MNISAVTLADDALFLLLCFFLPYIFFFIITKLRKKNGIGKIPPGPRRLPVVGNIFQVGFNPHRSFATLSRTYGPVMSLKLGSINTVIISSPEAAKEALKTHDPLLSARNLNDPVRLFDHHEHSILYLPSSPRWRFLRKITATHLLSTQKLNALEPLRMKKVKELLSFVTKCCEKGEVVNIAHASFVLALNIISNALFSVDFATHESSSTSRKLYDAVVNLSEIAARPNVGDYFPFLVFLDLQGIRKDATLCFERLYKIFQEFIDARIKNKEASKNDMLDSLLDIANQNESEFTINGINHLLLDLFIAGTDTSSSTIEWAMTELLCNPETMAKAQIEIRQVIGENGVVQESDISRLTYLQAIVKETLRLHPAGPLVSRKAESDLQISGFHIPKDIAVVVNVWAIGRDSSVWENPMKFEPERFLFGEIDVKGNDFKLIPFGAGRRICPGMSMALRTVSLVLASLLYSFDWKLQNGVVPQDIDMTETYGVTSHKTKPLYALPFKKHVTSS